MQDTEVQYVTRDEAERLIVVYQLSELAASGCRITCELYAARGGTCSGLNHLTDLELQQIYGPYIAGLERLRGDALVNAIIEFERTQLDDSHRTTCQVMQETGRVCDGFNNFTDEELPRLFPEPLAGKTILPRYANRP